MEDEWLIIAAPSVEQRWYRIASRLLKAIRLAANASYAGAYLNWWQRRGEAVSQYRQLESSANMLPRHLDPRKHLISESPIWPSMKRSVAKAKAKPDASFNSGPVRDPFLEARDQADEAAVATAKAKASASSRDEPETNRPARRRIQNRAFLLN